MAAARHATGWEFAAAILASMIGLLAAHEAGARMLDTLFPEGVPGYGAALGVTVLSRLRTETEPLGLREGPFRLDPRLETTLGYDDNVLGGTSRRGSWLVRNQASSLLRGDWNGTAIGGYAQLADTRYPNLVGQGRTDGLVALGGSQEFGRDRLTLAGSYVATHQDRTDLDAIPSDKPVGLRIADTRAEYTLRSGAFAWTPHLAYAQWRFANTTIGGVPTTQSYRDRDVLTAGLTTRYELAPLRHLVALAQMVRQTYPTPGASLPAPNSTGLRVLVGLDYADDAVWRYRLLVGVESRQFSAAAYRAHSGLTAEAEVIWTPTAMTTIRAGLLRGIEDAAQEGIAGFTHSAARLRVDHELGRDILLHATIGLRQAAFLQGGGTQWGYGFGVGATWLINRTLRLTASYDTSGVRGGGGVGVTPLNGDYSRNISLLTLRAGW
jgi:hypothetical protein